MSIDFGKIGSGIANAASTAANSIKDAALWTGHTISKGCVKFADAIKTCWNNAVPFIKNTAQQTGHYIKLAAQETGKVLNTPAGAMGITGALGVGSALTAGYLAYKGGDQKTKVATLAFGALALASFAGLGVAAGVGLKGGFTAPLV